jgi:hypothetical protein
MVREDVYLPAKPEIDATAGRPSDRCRTPAW